MGPAAGGNNQIILTNNLMNNVKFSRLLEGRVERR